MKKLMVALSALCVALGAAVAAMPFSCGTYVVMGAVVDWQNALFGKGDGVVVQAVDANGNILAEAPVFDSTEGVNFRLQVPVNSVAGKTAAAVGDELRLYILDANGRSASDCKVKVESAEGFRSVRLVAVDTEEFETVLFAAYGVDGKVRVTKAYLDEIRPWMEAYGYPVYLPDADWDNDGVANYLEYLGGTNPFDASDHLAVLDFATITDFATAGTKLKLTFECVQGHTYLIMGTTDLRSPDWRAEKVTASPDTTPTVSEYSAPESGRATLYMVPAVDVTGKFFKVEPK